MTLQVCIIHVCCARIKLHVPSALAIYSRSPAAFEAVRNLGILQLPNRSSLQAFLSNERSEPGANEGQIAAQFELYEKYKKEQVSGGHHQPQGYGILIFDEVRVQGKVVWNSKNNQIIGVAMTPSDLPALQDVYTSLDDAQKVQETRYILQFVWRDLTGSFDVVGPHYTSSDGFDAKFTLACLFDAMLVFETYNFHVGAIVGDGASWNQALFKKLSGHTGKFGTESISASFTNPFSGWRTWCIVCPSHEVK